MFAIFVSFTVAAVRCQYITILELSTTTLFTSPLLCPHLPPIVHPPPLPHKPPVQETFSGQISLNDSADRYRNKKMPINYY